MRSLSSFDRCLALARSVVFLSFGCCLLSSPLGAQGTTELSGTVRFFGCIPNASELSVVGEPVAFGALESSDPGMDSVPPAHAIIDHTSDPRVLRFRIFGAPDQLYRARIRFASERCGQLFWEAPGEGLLVPGARPIEITGYAVHSHLEILGDVKEGRREERWVGADFLDPAKPGRKIRWSSTLRGLNRGVIQYSTERFPVRDSPTTCANPPGLVYSASFPAEQGAWNTLPDHDFSTILARIGTSGRLGAQKLRLLQAGAPLYIRVLPAANERLLCDSVENGPAPWILVALSARITFMTDPVYTTPTPVHVSGESTYQPGLISDQPEGKQRMYRVVKPHLIVPWKDGFHDSFGYWIYYYGIAPPWTVVQPGFRFLLWSSSGGFNLGNLISGAVSIITSPFDALGLMVNQLAEWYEVIKAAVVNVAASAISATGLYDCDASPTCRQLVQMALETAMTSMGLPPSLPDWDQVADMGIDYMAAELVTQAGVGNVPGAQQLTGTMAKKLAGEAVSMIKQSRGGGNGLPDWLMNDIGLVLPHLELKLTHNGNGTEVPSSLGIHVSSLFKGMVMGIPSKWPNYGGQYTLSVPVKLRPNFADLSQQELDWLNQFPPGNPWALKFLFSKKYRGTPCAFFTLQPFKWEPGWKYVPLPHAKAVNIHPQATSVFASPHPTCPQP